MTQWLGFTIALLASGIVALVLGLKLRGAVDDLEMWRTQARRTAAELVETRAAASDELRRKEALIHVLRVDLDAQRAALAEVARTHPELAADFLRAQLRPPAAGAGADPHVAVSGPPAAADTAGTGERRG